MLTLEKVKNETVTIRKALKSDAVSLASIHSNTLKVAYKGFVPMEELEKVNFSNRLKYFKEVLENEKEDIVVAVIKDLPVGFMTFGQARDEDLDHKCAEIWNIYIDTSYFNKGIGKSLISWLENKFSASGFKSIYLWNAEDNLRAKMFYNSLGYVRDGKTKRHRIGDIRMARFIKNIEIL